MHLTAAEIAALVDGRIEGTAEAVVNGAEVDSRMLNPGDVFVALPGARVDGHQFVAAAFTVATAALVRHEAELAPPPAGRALIRVADPLAAYHALARHQRAISAYKVLALTGSVGKTTTKDFLAALVAPHFRTGATAGNRNSIYGLPAQVLSQPDGLELFVAEAGMTKAGELDQLGQILTPDLLLYTRIVPVHIEFFASLEALVEAKAELLPYLRADGLLIVNANDPMQQGFAARTRAEVREYGHPGTAAWAEDVEDLGLAGSRFTLVANGRRAEVNLPLAGRHQRENLVAAAAAANAFGVSPQAIAEGAGGLRAAPHRGRLHRLAGDTVVVDDSYNASPEAVRRMLDLLAAAPARRRIAVLGEMYELGTMALIAHRELGAQAASSCDLLLAVGGDLAVELAAAACDAGLPDNRVEYLENAALAAVRLADLVEDGDVVLVKGSRGVGLERVVEALVGEAVI